MVLQGETGWTAPPPYSAGIPSVLKSQKHALFFYRSIIWDDKVFTLERKCLFKIPQI
jgi:hypothetical protein